MKKLFITHFLILSILQFCATNLFAQTRSEKRGICWDEATQKVSDAPMQKMAPGISWFYNWGVAPQGQFSIQDPQLSIQFVPMCWNASFNETQLRNYLSQHQGEVKYLLAFNEPNLAWNVGGSQMTPQQAVTAWPSVKQVAKDFGLQIVAPALNFSGDQVGGRVWSPFEWYDEFFRLLEAGNIDPEIDYLAFHSYMNWYSAVNWVASEYFYTDKESSDLFTATNKAKYPNLVKYLEDYKTANGHFPRMFLTEFCAWEGDKDGYTSSVDSQIDQMTQKVQKLEQSDLVAGYAWFMGNTSQAPTVYPYNSVFESNTANSELSTLGQVYVHMSSFDTGKWYALGETILAKDYVNASMDNQQAKVRPNTESGSTVPLQVEWQKSAWTAYQIELPADATITLTLHIKSTTTNAFRIYENALGAANKRLDTTLPSTNGVWADVTTEVTLPAGQHTLLLYNMGTTSIFVNSLRFDAPTGIETLRNGENEKWRNGENEKMRNNNAVHDLSGRKVADNSSFFILHSSLKPGLYIRNGKKFVVK